MKHMHSLLVSLGSFATIAVTPALSEPTIDCSVPAAVSCEISEPSGIAAVSVTLDTALGPIDVVDRTYSDCPASVTVTWDPIVPGGDIAVIPCRESAGNVAGTFKTEGRRATESRQHFTIAVAEQGDKPEIEPQTGTFLVGVVADDAGNVSDVFCDTIAACEIAATICDEKGGVGECFEDHCVCHLD